MGKRVTTEFYCDRCKETFLKECTFVIEDLSFQASGYDPRGSGGASHKAKDLCPSCSKKFYDWFFLREVDLK